MSLRCLQYVRYSWIDPCTFRNMFYGSESSHGTSAVLESLIPGRNEILEAEQFMVTRSRVCLTWSLSKDCLCFKNGDTISNLYLVEYYVRI